MDKLAQIIFSWSSIDIGWRAVLVVTFNRYCYFVDAIYLFQSEHIFHVPLEWKQIETRIII